MQEIVTPAGEVHDLMQQATDFSTPAPQSWGRTTPLTCRGRCETLQHEKPLCRPGQAQHLVRRYPL